MTSQALHDIWLILTVIAILEVSAVAIYLLQTFRYTRRKFFWVMALAFVSIAVEYITAEIKNLSQPPPLQFGIALQWVAGRVQECVVLGLVVGYLVFGRNGDNKAEHPQETS